MNDQDILNREVGAMSTASTSGEFKLAVAVILETFLDCRRRYVRVGIDRLRVSEPYLSIAYPAEIMRFWCDSAGIDADAMAERFRKAMRSEKTAEVMFNNLRGWPTGSARNV